MWYRKSGLPDLFVVQRNSLKVTDVTGPTYIVNLENRLTRVTQDVKRNKIESLPVGGLTDSYR